MSPPHDNCERSLPKKGVSRLFIPRLFIRVRGRRVLGSSHAVSCIEMLLKAELESLSLPRAGKPTTISSGAA